MIKTLIKLKILKFILIGSASAAYAFKKYCDQKNIILMGGCALNCLANSRIPSHYNIWIMPSPGDAGSSLGAAALIERKKLNWQHPYLGWNINREVNPKKVVDYLLKNKYCGIANGRAEFGPRALGNRTLIADPRNDEKDTVNDFAFAVPNLKSSQLFPSIV